MDLFSPFSWGNVELSNRVVMAPMTRSRATSNLPNELMRQYYTQRASAGLIVTEGTAPSPNGLGYARIPGLFSRAQVEAWRSITRSVHDAGGRIVAQLMHTGRIAHPSNLPPGARVLAPSAVRAQGTMYTDQTGPEPFPEPEALSGAELAEARDEYVSAARNAMDAGFDGVELHAANGYLLEQFLHPHTNRRTDEYGGSAANRSRFVLETAEAVGAAIGTDRVGIRLSPFSTFNDLPPHDEVREQYRELARNLRDLGYLHLVASPHVDYPETAKAIRGEFDGTLILNGGFDAARAQTTLDEGDADLIAFGRPFIGNPDLVARLRARLPLAAPVPATFYTPGPEGYVDYAVVSAPFTAPLTPPAARNAAQT